MEVWITTRQEEPYRRYLPGILLEAVLIFLVNGVGTFALLKMLVSVVNGVPFFLSVMCTVLACALIEKLSKHVLVPVLTVSAAILGGLLTFSSSILNGCLFLWNQLAEVLGKKAGIYLTVYQITDSGNASEEMAFLVFLGIACGLLGFFILKLRLYVVLLVFATVLPVLMVKTGLFPDTRLCLCFYAGVLLELNYMAKNKRGKSGADVSAFFTGAACLLLVSAAGGLFLQNLVPKNDYQDSQLAADAKEEALQGLSRLRYKGKKANSLPDGKLKQTGSWSASSDTALEVTMEHPASLYLRGFVGSVYDGSSWESISAEEAYKEKDLFYWLHKDGFYGETQLQNARNLVQDDSLSNEKGTITVKNKTASSKYLYTPYELTDLPDGCTGETAQADSTLNARGLFGKRTYSFSSLGNLVGDFTTLGAKTYQTLTLDNNTGDSENDAASAYRSQESYYNTFVYQEDTQLPASLENLFRKELGDGGNRDEGHTDYYTAITRIRSYLEKNMTYSSQSDVFSEDGDFTENFLTSSKIGHSVHFATAAALMFRYYGIPARYVEGYLITPQDVKGKQAGDTIEIPGTNGHAWTEIYVDGLGWIPLEMTPSYYGVMEEADLKTGLEAKGKLAASIPETESQPPVEENIRTNFSLKLALFGIEKFLLLFLIVFDSFLFLFILAVVSLRALTNYKRRKRFTSPDTQMAVRAMAGYARVLYEHGEQYSKETMLLYKNVTKIGQKAAFSPHPVSASERHDTASCIRHLKKELRASTSWYDRWIMKYIERLY